MELTINKTVAPVVDFNEEAINKFLDTQLANYECLVFTEETVKDCKKTVAELRKAQKNLDDFRKKTKKELSAPIKEFEDKCKTLSARFDEVINPIVEQADQFEEKRKEEKREEVIKIIQEVCEKKGIESLPLDEKYLNKSMSNKAIKTDLNSIADQILIEEDNRKKNIALLEGRVELAKAKHGCDILIDPYIRMLPMMNIDDILKQIDEDGEKLKPVTQTVVEEPTKNEEIFEEVYKVEGSEAQLNALEKFLNDNNMSWKVVE